MYQYPDIVFTSNYHVYEALKMNSLTAFLIPRKLNKLYDFAEGDYLRVYHDITDAAKRVF